MAKRDLFLEGRRLRGSGADVPTWYRALSPHFGDHMPPPVATFKLSQFSSIRIFAHNVKKSRDWYAKLFDQAPVDDLENFVSFHLPGCCFDITVADHKNPFSSGGAVGYWVVDDLDTVLNKVEELGGLLYRGPLQVPELQRTIMQIQDPFGNVMGFEAPFGNLSK